MGGAIALVRRALSWPFWLALLGGCAVVLVAFSLDWGLARHAPARLYIAREILRGHAPYLQIVDLVAHFPWWDYDSGTPGFRRLDSWPELQAYLARDYRLDVERTGLSYQGGSGYRIYVRR